MLKISLDSSKLIFRCIQVESVLDKDGYTLEELLDEEEIIQECKALNSRLINLWAATILDDSLLKLIGRSCLYLSYFCLISIAILCYFEQLAFTFCSLRGKAQVRSLLCFVIEEPPENAENKRAFK